MLFNFRVAKYKFKIIPQGKVRPNSFFTATLRGGFGYSFKKVACIVKDKKCHECILSEKCVYSYIFETPVPSGTKIMKKYTQVPHPFIIEPPPTDKDTNTDTDVDTDRDREVEFGLVLIGKAIDYLPYFIYTFEEFGKNGIGKDKIKFILDEIRCNITNKIVYKSNEKKLMNDYKIIKFDDLKTEDYKTKNKLTINFLTPTRIKYNEKLVSIPEFHILIRNLLRRISLLSYFHCNEELSIDFLDLIKKSENVKVAKSNLIWYDFERYSTRQNQKMKLGGFVGEITYEGNIDEFLKYLLLGEYIHIGKACTFGLGRYKMKIA